MRAKTAAGNSLSPLLSLGYSGTLVLAHHGVHTVFFKVVSQSFNGFGAGAEFTGQLGVGTVISESDNELVKIYVNFPAHRLQAGLPTPGRPSGT